MGTGQLVGSRTHRYRWMGYSLPCDLEFLPRIRLAGCHRRRSFGPRLLNITFLMCVEQSIGHGAEQRDAATQGTQAVGTPAGTCFAQAVVDLYDQVRNLGPMAENKDYPSIKSKGDELLVATGMLEESALQSDTRVAEESRADLRRSIQSLQTTLDRLRRTASFSEALGVEEAQAEAIQVTQSMLKFVGLKPRHNGVVVSALEHRYFLEATVSSSGEFRLYLHDPCGQAVSVGSVTAGGRIVPNGTPSANGSKVEMGAGPQKAYLLARIDSRLRPPFVAQMYVKFGDDKNPKAFEFVFDARR